MIVHADCLEHLRTLDACSLDSLVTDPPAGIAFMGKDWDKDRGGRDAWVKWMTEVMRECLRVLKPGAHGLVWTLPRTSHWTATALEDAGFEIRDVVTHLFGTGFPKSLDVSKAIDKAAGAEREVIGVKPWTNAKMDAGQGVSGMKQRGSFAGEYESERVSLPVTAPTTDAARQWQGWGTALKPASEHWILVRKPCSEKTVAANVLKWGTGAINVDGARIAAPGGLTKGGACKGESALPMNKANGLVEARPRSEEHTQGRFPANLVLSHNEDCDAECSEGCVVKALDEQSGTLKSGAFVEGTIQQAREPKAKGAELERVRSARNSDSGGASRFFYCAKASKSDRGTDNKHPTVKSTKLMAYLIKLVTPPKGIVLDPFAGSGSTGVAALSQGFQFLGIEQSAEYVQIAEKRLGA